MNGAPRVLVSGVVLGQPMGGVRRHNQELLPRVARLLAEGGGALALLEGALPAALELPESVARLRSSVPAGPPSLRAIQEGAALRERLEAAAASGAPFDVVHTGHLPVPLRLPVPLALTLHDLRSVELAELAFARRAVARRVIARAVRTARLVVTVSAHVGERLEELFAVPPERRALVPNAADHFAPLPRAAAPGAPLVHVGHVEPRKNLELVVRALAHDASLPPLELFGAAKGDAAERLLALASELGVAERVRVRGPFDDAELASIYARAACAVLPSRLEGFGIGALEAQRARVPLAIAAAGALVEVAGDDVPRFAPNDAPGCAAAIRAALAQDAATLARAAERAARFTWDASAARLVDAWRACARG